MPFNNNDSNTTAPNSPAALLRSRRDHILKTKAQLKTKINKLELCLEESNVSIIPRHGETLSGSEVEALDQLVREGFISIYRYAGGNETCTALVVGF